ncbi:MAG: DUF2569 domain-containing protein, partial [Bacteroidia bacterium]|nr:DUF2569 domain-containing protein [Bacteroidia bacterium]
SGNRLRLEYSYTGKCAYVDSVDYPAYKEEAKFLDNNLIFTTTQTLTDEKVHSFNWLYALTQIAGLVLSFFICFFFYKKSFNYTHKAIYTSIDGWLIVLAIGLCLSPFILLINNISGIGDKYKIDFYAMFLDSSVSTYNPIKGIIIIAETFCNMLILMMSIFLLPLFFLRNNSFRVYYIFYRIFYAVFVIADSIVVANYFEDSPDTTFKTGISATEWMTILLPIAIWVPYVWFSERSRGTFTVGNVFEGGPAETPQNLN